MLIFHSLSFETNGGSEIETLRKLRGTRIDLSGYVPTKDGYVFTGWFADSSLTEKVTSVDLNSDTTVYAGWLAEAGSLRSRELRTFQVLRTLLKYRIHLTNLTNLIIRLSRVR